jgi:hypothetical protein
MHEYKKPHPRDAKLPKSRHRGDDKVGRKALTPEYKVLAKYGVDINPFDTIPKNYIGIHSGIPVGDMSDAKLMKMRDLYNFVYDKFADLECDKPFYHFTYPQALVYNNGVNQPIRLAVELEFEIESYSKFIKLYDYVSFDVSMKFILEEERYSKKLALTLVANDYQLSSILYHIKYLDRKVLAD